jgi:hypothetical protein
VKNKFLLYLLILIFSNNFFGSAYAATPKEKAPCPTINKVVKSGKNTLICLETITGSNWIKVIVISSKVSQLKIQANQIIQTLNSNDTSTVSRFLEKGLTLQKEYDQKNIEWKEAETTLTAAIAEKNATENSLKDLPSSIAQANALVTQSNTVLTVSQQAYTSLRSQLTAMSFEYDPAIRAKSAYVTCRVLNDFGFQAGGCGYYNSYYDIVIGRYNSLETQVNSAYATYDSNYTTYKNNYEKYKTLLESQSTLVTKINDLGQKIVTLQENYNTIELQSKALNTQKAIFDLVSPRSDFYFSAASNLVSEIQQVLDGNSKTWVKKLAPVLLQYQVFLFDFGIISSNTL